MLLANDYDPFAGGYVASLARPGGNVTGVFLQQVELTAKRLEFLSQTVPDLDRVVALWDRISADQFEIARDAARTLRIRLDGVECTDPPYDYERVLAGVDGAHRDVLLQLNSGVFFRDRQRLPATALDHRLPSIFPFRQWVDEGGLMSYGASLTDMSRWPRIMSIGSLRVPSPLTCRSSSRPGSSSSSTSRPPKRSALLCRHRSSPAPTR